MQSICLQPSNMYPKWNYSVPILYSKSNAILSNDNGQLYDIGKRKHIDKPIGEFNSTRTRKNSYSTRTSLSETCVFTRDIISLRDSERDSAEKFNSKVASNKRYNWDRTKRNLKRIQHRQFGLLPDTRLAIYARRNFG